jgi:hypothetical protein
MKLPSGHFVAVPAHTTEILGSIRYIKIFLSESTRVVQVKVERAVYSDSRRQSPA